MTQLELPILSAGFSLPAEIVENLQAALEQFTLVAEALSKSEGD